MSVLAYRPGNGPGGVLPHWLHLNEVAPAGSPKHSAEYAMNKDQVKGRVKEVKGKVKEVTGRIIGDKTMENKGKLQNATGKAQKAFGDVKEDIKDAL